MCFLLHFVSLMLKLSSDIAKVFAHFQRQKPTNFEEKSTLLGVTPPRGRDRSHLLRKLCFSQLAICSTFFGLVI